MRFVLLSSSVLVAVGFVTLGCDDVPLGVPRASAPAGPIPDNPTSCDVASRLTEVHCTGCHGGGTEPLLTLEGLAALVNKPSSRYAGATLVVPADAESSLFFRKIAGPHDGEGAQMPLGGGAVDETLVAMVGTWIDEGASTDCTPVVSGEGEGEGEGVVLVPGGPIDVGVAPDGFDSSPPSFAPDVPCSTNQWWQHEGDHQKGPHMNPGRACISCHVDSGEDDAPRFAFAGTVMGGLRDGDLCRGVPGTTVEILNAADEVVASTTTNAAGNFMLFDPATRPFRVRLHYQGRTREMFGHQDAVGDCMSCHSAERDATVHQVVCSHLDAMLYELTGATSSMELAATSPRPLSTRCLRFAARVNRDR